MSKDKEDLQPKDKLVRDINLRKKDMTWVALRNLLFRPLLKLRSISPDFEEDWLTLIFDVPNRPIKNFKVVEEFEIRGRYVRVPRETKIPAPRSTKVMAGTVLTTRQDLRTDMVYDVEVDALPGDSSMLTRWFRVNQTEMMRIKKWIKEIK